MIALYPSQQETQEAGSERKLANGLLLSLSSILLDLHLAAKLALQPYPSQSPATLNHTKEVSAEAEGSSARAVPCPLRKGDGSLRECTPGF